MHRRDRFLVRVAPEHALAVAGDPSRFPEFNPLVRVPAGSGRVEQVGNVYYQVLALGPIRASTRWETIRTEPDDLRRQPRPSPPWTTVEVGRVPLFGAWISTTRYQAVSAGTLITHDLEYGVPDGLPGRVVDVALMRPLLAVGMGLLGRRLRRWIEAG